MRARLFLLLFSIMVLNSTYAQKKREIVPRDTITGKYSYDGVEDSIKGTKAQLAERLDKWVKQNYAREDKYAKVTTNNDTWVLHDREALPGKARKFIEYNLTVDLKDGRYRYKLTDIDYIAVGKYPLEDKMATDKKSDFEDIHTILSGILASLEAALRKGDDW